MLAFSVGLRLPLSFSFSPTAKKNKCFVLGKVQALVVNAKNPKTGKENARSTKSANEWRAKKKNVRQKYFKFSLHIYAVVVRYSENVCLLLSFTSCYGRADVIFFPLLVSSFLAYCKIQWHTTNQNKRANSTKTAANANQIHLLCISVHLVHSFCDFQPSSAGVLSLWLGGSVPS